MPDELQLFTHVIGDRVLYGFGEDWVAMAMYVDDYGFPTEEEAVLDWYHNYFKKGKSNGSANDNSAYEE